MKVEINKKRLEYLLALYKMSVDDLLSLLNKGSSVFIHSERQETDNRSRRHQWRFY